jgi:hypothetical protein
LIGKNGFTTGTYGENVKVTLTYKVKLADNIVADKKCNTRNAFKNQIIVDYNVGTSNDTGEVYDSATIYVTRDCQEEGCDPKTDPTCKECEEGDPGCNEEPTCKEGDPNCTPTDDECKDGDTDCICKKDPKNSICSSTVKELPKTGPGEVALAIVAVVCITTGGIYWYRSQKDLMAIQSGVTKGKK